MSVTNYTLSNLLSYLLGQRVKLSLTKFLSFKSRTAFDIFCWNKRPRNTFFCQSVLKFYLYSLYIMNPFVVLCVMYVKTLLRIIFCNSSLEFLVFILTIHVPRPLNIFILKNLDSMSNRCFLACWGQNLEWDTSNS